MKKPKLETRTIILGFVLFSLLFGIYIAFLYRQVTESFVKKEEFIPTRIYSDVSKIGSSELRSRIESRLKSLGYTFESKRQEISFSLRAIEYPEYLLPEGHPTFAAAQHRVKLSFKAEGGESAIEKIEIESGGNFSEVPELYLEPELIATLGRGTSIRAPLKFSDIPARVWQAIIAIEDQHYLEHSGFDPKGLARAIFVNLKTLSFAQGGSTLTQQLVKNLMARRTKNVFRKVNELFLSILLEFRFEKEQILERYLNEVYLGQIGSMEVHGVAEGAKHFFRKNVNELNLAEIALMAGLIRGPAFYSPYRYLDRAVDRQKLVLKKMVETGQIAEGEMQEALKQPIRLAPPQSYSNKAPYFTDFVKAELIRLLKDKATEEEIISQGFRVYTTVDLLLNEAAQNAVATGIDALETRFKLTPEEKKTSRLEGALASVDHHTGALRALIGGRSYSVSNFNRILNMKRQVGSTFKPIVYLTALLKGEDSEGTPFTPAYPFEDAPWTYVYDGKKQKWSPKNYEKDFQGWVPLRKALAHSINTVAAKLGVAVGIDSVIEVAHSLGIQTDLPEVPSLSLGVAELSPVELVQAYSTIANQGVRDELTAIRGILTQDGKPYARFVYQPKEVLPRGATDLLTDMMTSTFTEGTAKFAKDMGWTRPAAGKTGTTSNHRDSWFAGFTPELTTVVWVGLDQTDSAPTDSKILLTGAGGALPIWVQTMRFAHKGLPEESFLMTEEIQEAKFDGMTGKLASSFCSGQVITDHVWRKREPSQSSCEQSPSTSVKLNNH